MCCGTTAQTFTSSCKEVLGSRSKARSLTRLGLNLMHAQVAEAWTVESIARQVGMSRSGFAARFTAIVGEPPLQYLARWRVTRAGELLRTTSDKVETIARSSRQ